MTTFWKIVFIISAMFLIVEFVVYGRSPQSITLWTLAPYLFAVGVTYIIATLLTRRKGR